jgi:two-component system alkaline phosphatase synthesis response regulator PhoP
MMGDGMTKTILVVDDEADVRNFLTAALVEAGFNVVTANDGIEALEKVNEKVPDLISLDLVMPKKSGVRFYRELVKKKEWSKIPILIVTGHARDELGKADLKELTMSGPGIYLEKPIKPESYIAAIKQILGMESSAEERQSAELVSLQSELKNLIDDADTETLQKLRKMIKKSRSD